MTTPLPLTPALDPWEVDVKARGVQQVPDVHATRKRLSFLADQQPACTGEGVVPRGLELGETHGTWSVLWCCLLPTHAPPCLAPMLVTR